MATRTRTRVVGVVGAIAAVVAVTAGTIVVASGSVPVLLPGQDPGCQLDEGLSDLTRGVTDMSPSGEYFVAGGPRSSAVTLRHENGDSEQLSANDLATELGDATDGASGATPTVSEAVVNSSGEVAGVLGWDDEYGGTRSGTGWIYRDGEVTGLELPDEIPVPDGEWGVQINDIGEDGTVVGFFYADTNFSAAKTSVDPDHPPVPLRWAPDETKATVLDHEDATLTMPTAVHADGTTIGIQLTPDAGATTDAMMESEFAVAWNRQGEMRKLPFDGLDFPAHLYNQYPKLAGDWIHVGGQVWNMSGSADPERTNLGLDEESAVFIDERGYIYGPGSEGLSAYPTAESRETLRMEIPEPPEFDDTEWNMTDAAVRTVSADGGIVLGFALYVSETDGDGTDEDFFEDELAWRCVHDD